MLPKTNLADKMHKHEFVLLQEKQEAERKKIEATGIRDAPYFDGGYDHLSYNGCLEVLGELADSPNSKLIITGKHLLSIQSKKMNN